jgi:thiol-disulfide isomerase/thioredoxin
MKKFLLIPLILLVLIFSGCSSNIANDLSKTEKQEVEILGSSDGKLTVYFFWGEGCPHCEDQKPFLEEMSNKYPELEVKMYETWRNPQNISLFKEIAGKYGIEARGVPVTFIGDFEPIVGFTESMKDDIEDKIKTCLVEGCVDPSEK